MTQTTTAVFDGLALHPDLPLDLEPNRRYKISVEVEPEAQTGNDDVWSLLEKLSGSVDAPEDWSAEHDHYLYGTPKRNGKSS